ncbi:MAG: hypothetical protein Kow0031_02720 [Anaerolineae bacterium]
MHAGIDIGYDSTKVIAGDRQASFKSVVGTAERSRFSLNGHHDSDIILNDNGAAWLVGDAAVTHSRFINRREDAGWYQSDEYRRLMLAAFGQLTSGTSVKLTVVTGLPVAYYTTGKDELGELFSGRHRLEIEGRTPQQIEVAQCRVIPQPFGTVLALALNDAGRLVDREVATGPVGVVDIGGKTTNLLSARGLSDVSRETTSVNLGAWDVVRAVREHLTTTCAGLDLRDHEVMEAIRQREVWYYGERVDLAEVVDDKLATMAHTVIATATQLWNGGAGLRAVLITGGGAHLLGDPLRQAFRHARIVDNPRYANALGYYRLAVFLAQNGR